ncbi:hypothetical protein TNCV_3155231 [Trichonephila clavipes]|nr:hypothetical protein TNCV_3155231 [Trichonephila clavipes]
MTQWGRRTPLEVYLPFLQGLIYGLPQGKKFATGFSFGPDELAFVRVQVQSKVGIGMSPPRNEQRRKREGQLTTNKLQKPIEAYLAGLQN